MASTGTSIIVFLPLVLGGRTEITTWIGEVGRTIIFTLLCSLFISLTAIPLALGRFLHVGAVAAHAGDRVDHGAPSPRAGAGRSKHRPATAGIALGIVALAFFPFMRKSTRAPSPATSVEAVRIEYEFADNLNRHETERYVTAVEGWIQARQGLTAREVDVLVLLRQRGDDARVPRSGDGPTIRRRRSSRDMLRKGLPELPGVKLKLAGQDDDSGPTHRGEAVRRAWARASIGSRPRSSAALSTSIGRHRRRAAAASAARGRRSEVAVDRDQAYQHGLNTAQVGAHGRDVLPRPAAVAIPRARGRGADRRRSSPSPTAPASDAAQRAHGRPVTAAPSSSAGSPTSRTVDDAVWRSSASSAAR